MKITTYIIYLIGVICSIVGIRYWDIVSKDWKGIFVAICGYLILFGQIYYLGQLNKTAQEMK